MDIKPPIPDISDLLAPLWVWVISTLGAFAAYLEDFKPEDTWRIRLMKAAARLSSSALAAILTYNALLGLGVPQGYWVVTVGISGHMGPEALRIMGEVFRRKASTA
jgi:D-arabinose 1-dehydrogenase-like Zn-dependent alcohol dehydrogenase